MSNDLKKEMMSYTDERILNNIKQQDFFSKEVVATAKEIAVERGLLSEDQIGNIDEILLRQRQAKAAQPYTPKSGGTTIAVSTVIIICLVILRMVLRAMNN